MFMIREPDNKDPLLKSNIFHPACCRNVLQCNAFVMSLCHTLWLLL